MAWQTPKTNWQAADVVSKDDFNRIEGNIQHLQDTKETPAGAQAKADAAEARAKAYTDQEVAEVSQALAVHLVDDTRHVSQTEKDIWNSKAEGNHNHDSRYVQTRVYNGALQYYYDGGWKDVAVSPIKSIQRGTHAGSDNDITITINTVNPAKCMVILNSSFASYRDAHTYAPILKNITSNSLVVSKSRAGTAPEAPFSWQVIEYN